MPTFKGSKITNEYKGDLIRQWENNGSRKVDDIFGPYKPYQLTMLKGTEDYLKDLNVPFITTCTNNEYSVWKEQKAEHVR